MDINKVVVVSREAEIQQLARVVGKQVFVADDLSEALDIVKTVNSDLILFDPTYRSNNICKFMESANGNLTNIPVIAIDDDDDADKASSKEFIRIGAGNYLQGKQSVDQLCKRIISRITERSKTNNTDTSVSEQNEKSFFAEDLASTVSMVGKSHATLDALKMINLVAASQCNPILILGETGTGKELAAKAIHTLRHPNERFVAINCAALTSNLLESELFGHVKGAFTSADCEKTGLLELAGSGTLLLDEISEMPIQLQAKLLRVLEEKNFRKVGGTKSINCNATIIAASNCNLDEEVKENRFRRDLYYRLNISPITLAPLRVPERREDIPLLAKYFLKTSSICPIKHNKIKSLTSMAIEALVRHDWPGNVRELRNVIERAILLEATDKIGLNDIVFEPLQYCQKSRSLTTSVLKDFSLEKAERELISRALLETGWHKTHAAALLGITRATLYAKVKQYNIEKDSSEVSFPTNQKQREPVSSYSS